MKIFEQQSQGLDQQQFDNDEAEDDTEVTIDENQSKDVAKAAEVSPNYQTQMNLSNQQFLTQFLDKQIVDCIMLKTKVDDEKLASIGGDYLTTLTDAGIDKELLVPQKILAKYKDAYLVKWFGLPFDQSSFESLIFLHQYQDKIVEFFLEQSQIKIYSLFHFAVSEKYWLKQQPIELPLGKFKELVHVPPYIAFNKKKLFEYQLIGINWLIFNHLNQRGCLFCDEMGLGKTIQICGLIAALCEYGTFGPHLIICPTSTIENWYRELNKWLPFLNIAYLSLTDVESIEINLKSRMQSNLLKQINQEIQYKEVVPTDENSQKDLAVTRSSLIYQCNNILNNNEFPTFQSCRIGQFNGAIENHIYLVSYDTLFNLTSRRLGVYKCQKQIGKQTVKYDGFQQLLEAIGQFSTVTCDEAHKLKGGVDTQLFQVLDKIQAVQRIILTGTPIQNNFGELLNLLQFVDSNTFTKSFQDQLSILAERASSLDLAESEKQNALAQIHQSIKPYMLVRKQKDVFQHEIQKVEMFVPVDMTDIQKQLYGRIIFDNRKKLIEQNKLSIQEIQILRHVTNHPLVINRNYQSIIQQISTEQILNMSSKMQIFARLLECLLNSKRKTLVYSQYVMVLNVIQEYLYKNSINFLRIDGSTSLLQRQQFIDKYSNDSVFSFPVFLLSTNAGGLGINLQAASDVIIFDSSWNPQNDIQAIHRAARIGQQNIVRVYKLFCRDTIDQKIVERAKLKLSRTYIFVRPVVDKGIDDINKIIQFGCQNIMESFKQQIQKSSLDELQEVALHAQQQIIEYSKEHIEEMINKQAEINVLQKTNCPFNEKVIDKEQFLSGFKCASFQFIAAPIQQQQQPVMEQSKQQVKCLKRQDLGDIIWKNLFSSLFVEEPTEKQKQNQDRIQQRIKIIEERNLAPASSESEISENDKETNDNVPVVDLQQTQQQTQMTKAVQQVKQSKIVKEVCIGDQHLTQQIVSICIDEQTPFYPVLQIMFQEIMNMNFNQSISIAHFKKQQKELMQQLITSMHMYKLLMEYKELIIPQNWTNIQQIINLNAEDYDIFSKPECQLLFKQAELNHKSKICYITKNIFEVSNYQVTVNTQKQHEQETATDFEFQQYLYRQQYDAQQFVSNDLFSIIDHTSKDDAETLKIKQKITHIYIQLYKYYMNDSLQLYRKLMDVEKIIAKFEVVESLCDIFKLCVNQNYKDDEFFPFIASLFDQISKQRLNQQIVEIAKQCNSVCNLVLKPASTFSITEVFSNSLQKHFDIISKCILVYIFDSKMLEPLCLNSEKLKTFQKAQEASIIESKILCLVVFIFKSKFFNTKQQDVLLQGIFENIVLKMKSESNYN